MQEVALVDSVREPLILPPRVLPQRGLFRPASARDDDLVVTVCWCFQCERQAFICFTNVQSVTFGDQLTEPRTHKLEIIFQLKWKSA